jgi:Tol biopolymer transport system component
MISETLSAALADRYTIERELGEGGMATVYLAEDLKHKRKVAIKVLKPELAAVLGAERFVQEITTTAALQHPHILPLFDSGEVRLSHPERSDPEGSGVEGPRSFLYYVMPFIDGETLRGKLDRETQLGIDESVRIATDVASALHYAHTHGVIHRDIKPENILLHDGRPMVADFGIALALSAAAGGRMTETGMSLGTPHYMSPEQATAEKEITARSDVYSLGSVLYEMLTGNPPHTGSSAQQIIMKIIAEDAAPVTKLRKSVPANVAAAVGKSLEKLPADRFESAKAFGDALGNQAFRTTTTIRGHEAGEAGRSRARRAIGALAWCALGAVVAWFGLRAFGTSTQSRDVSRAQITYTGRAGSPAISPDGRFVAFVEERCPEPPATTGCINLEVLEVGSTRPVEIITGADRLTTPTWTHDGLSLVVAGALDAGREGLFVMPRLGGTPRRIADEPVAYDTHPSSDSIVMILGNADTTTIRVMSLTGEQVVVSGEALPFTTKSVAWSPDAAMFAVTSPGEGVHVVRRDGTVLSTRRINHRHVIHWSPDGRSILTFRWGAGNEDDLVALSVGTDGALGDPRVIASQLNTLFTGQFDVARETGRIAVVTGLATADIWSFDLTGSAVQARRLTQASNWYGPPVLTAHGDTLFFLRVDALGNNLYSIINGREQALTADRQIVNNTGRFSLDGRVFGFDAYNDDQAVFAIYDIASRTTRRVARTADEYGWVLPDNEGIVWLDTSNGTAWITDSAGNAPRALPAATRAPVPIIGGWRLAPDGGSLAVLHERENRFTVERLPLDGGPETTLASFQATVEERGLTGPQATSGIGLAAWSATGLYVARGGPAINETTVLRLNPATGITSPAGVLPVSCDPESVSVSADGKKAACNVPDARGDLILFDGLRP